MGCPKCCILDKRTSPKTIFASVRIKGNVTLSRETTVRNEFCLSSKKDSTFSEWDCCAGKQTGSHQLSPMYRMVVNLPSVSSPLKKCSVHAPTVLRLDCACPDANIQVTSGRGHFGIIPTTITENKRPKGHNSLTCQLC